MPFPFSCVCDLLEQAYKQSAAKTSISKTVVRWFAHNRSLLDAHDTDISAVLSTLLPEKRTDRVYCIQSPKLEKIIARALGLGQSRIEELTSYKQPRLHLDLADCVERILQVTPNQVLPHLQNVSIEEVDQLLHGLAARIKWSSPEVRASRTPLTQRGTEELDAMYRRLSAREAKWLTRLLLKSYLPLVFNEQIVYELCDPLLPVALKVQEDYSSALAAVQAYRKSLSPHTPASADYAKRKFAQQMKPKLGIKVGRQNWFKARSIKHCMEMAGRGRMSVEKKIDGEYCQIHVDPRKGRKGIQIFSKSGKDSTEDREKLITVIAKSLNIGNPRCAIERQCILEGELVVYNDAEKKIQPFHKIRQHVTRRGRFMNTEQDSAPSPSDHLMIVYYDILLLDDTSLLASRHSERFRHLEKVVCCLNGLAELVPRQLIDFDSNLGASHLRWAFAAAILAKEEGLVVKQDEPYFHFDNPWRRDAGLCIKLKKEYIGSFGEVGDFAAVGAGYDAAMAKSYSLPGVRWTHFFIGCLQNRDAVKQWKVKPVFKIVNCVDLSQVLMKTFVQHASPLPVPQSENGLVELEVPPGILAQSPVPLSVVFQNPLVFDMRCFSFEDLGNTGFFSMRFPTVAKIHFDRDFTDTISFSELQKLAEEALRLPDAEDSQENLEWIARLEAADPHGRAVDALSQLTATTAPTPSPHESTQRRSETPASPVRVERFPSISGVHLPDSWSLNPVSILAAAEITTQPVTATPSVTAPAGVYNTSPSPRGTKHALRDTTSSSSTSRKYQKSSEDGEKNQAPSTHRAKMIRQRKPLEEIDANMSQNSQSQQLSASGYSQHSTVSGNVPLAKYSEHLKCPDLDKHDEGPTISHKKIGPFPSIAEVQSENSAPALAVAWDDEPVNGQISEDIDLQRQARGLDNVPQFRTGGEVSETAGQYPPPTEYHSSQCKFLGEKCRFYGRKLLLAPDLVPVTPKLSELLGQHGVVPILNCKDAIREEMGEIKAGHVTVGAGENVLIVDTQEHKDATNDLLKWIEATRSSLPDGQRDWIHVYDWRMLPALTHLEDSNSAAKYHDRFDAWMRWFCGLV